MALTKIVSGGQDGVDQAALRAAQALGVTCGGWCPPGRKCNSGVIPEVFLLQETPYDRSPDAPATPRSLRTEWNVRDSAATIIFRPSIGTKDDPGTDFTERCAKEKYRRPCLACDPYSPKAVLKITRWIAAHEIQTLNVAGPSEDTVRGIGNQVFDLLTKIIQVVNPPFSLWLIPAPQRRQALRATITRLATNYRTPRFWPHVTACSGNLAADLASLRAEVDRLCRELGPVRMAVNGYGQADTYFTFLFIRLKSVGGDTVFRAFTDAIHGTTAPAVGPHLSLMYSDTGNEIPRHEIVQKLPRLPRSIAFEEVRIVMPQGGNWLNVDRWEVRHSARLRG